MVLYREMWTFSYNTYYVYGLQRFTPIDFIPSVFLQKFVGGTKVTASKEAMKGRKWTRVRALKHEVGFVVYQSLFLACVGAPKKEYDRLAFLIHERNDPVGQDLPSLATV